MRKAASCQILLTGPLILAVVLLGTSPAPAATGAAPDALADYVRRPDDSFSWKEVERREVEGVSAARLDCVSQTWRGNVWRHELLVVRPPKVTHPDIALLSIGSDAKVDRQIELLKTLALRAGAIAACINTVMSCCNCRSSLCRRWWMSPKARLE